MELRNLDDAAPEIQMEVYYDGHSEFGEDIDKFMKQVLERIGITISRGDDVLTFMDNLKTNDSLARLKTLAEFENYVYAVWNPFADPTYCLLQDHPDLLALKKSIRERFFDSALRMKLYRSGKFSA